MLDALPMWLQVPIGLAIAIGIFALWIKNLSDLWKQEQTRKATTRAERPSVAALPATTRPGRPSRETIDAVLLIGAALAIVVLANLEGFGNAGLRRLSMAGIIAAVAGQNLYSRRQAKQKAEREQHGDYQPFRDVISR